uniref:DUF1618 domain-containing protein n=1 Tax=Leersia perrieri TaxID=77586 RepID=A0A0D9VGW8_9ORYZ
MEEGSSTSSKRRRDDADYATTTLPQSTRRSARHEKKKKHLYLALDDWNGGYSIHKLDADAILYDDDDDAAGRRLPEPAAVRIASPAPRDYMSFAAVGTNIVIDTNPQCRHEHASPTLVYDTETSALTVGPHVPDGIHGLADASMGAVGETLYALTSSFTLDKKISLQALSWAPTSIPDRYPWEPPMEWSWKATVDKDYTIPYHGKEVVGYALHPDGRTIFVSSGVTTHTLDTSNGVWKDLGDWALPFRGQAFFDPDLDAWVGLHRNRDNVNICCCPVASRSTVVTSTRPMTPRCKVLREKLTRRKEGDTKYMFIRTGADVSLTYMGGGRFALVEGILRSEDLLNDGAVIHVTLFGLQYDHNGDLQTKVRRATRSYAVSKTTPFFSHAAFWM